MSEIPVSELPQGTLEEWYNVQEQLGNLKQREQLLRQLIFRSKFPNAVEGTNNLELDDGWVLKGKRTINRTVDEAAFKSQIEELAAEGIPTDTIVRYKPELATSVYRELTEEQRHLMDSVLVIKDGMPGLEIVLPKRRKG